MLCPVCQSTARIAKTRFVSDVGSTDVYTEQDIVCVNKNHEDNNPCPMYCEDLDNPIKIIDTIKNKIS